MISALHSPVGVSPNPYDADNAHEVRHRRQQADHHVSLYTQIRNDRWSPESKRRISAHQTEVNDRQEPYARRSQRCSKGVLSRPGLTVIRLEVRNDELLFVVA